MKILLVNKFHYRRGGSETYYFALAEQLRRMGHQVVFFSMRDERNEPCAQSEFFAENREYNGDTGALAKLKSAASLIYAKDNYRRMKALLEREKPDVAHLNLIHRQLTFSVVDALHDAGVPMVFTAHDLTCVCPAISMRSPNGLCERCLGGRFGACVKQRCIKGSLLKSALGAEEARYLRRHRSYDKIDLYIAPSNFIRDKLLAGRFTRSPIETMLNFLPDGVADACTPARDGALLFVGRLSQEKGALTLIRAMALLPNERLLVLGDGPERAAAEALLDELSLRGRVELRGQVSHDEVRAALRACKAVVLPSECYEAYGYAGSEALAQGKPILGAAIGGIPEQVGDDRGFLFDVGQPASLAQSVERLNALSDADFLRMSEAALSFARDNFDAQRYGEALVAKYDEIRRRHGA